MSGDFFLSGYFQDAESREVSLFVREGSPYLQEGRFTVDHESLHQGEMMMELSKARIMRGLTVENLFMPVAVLHDGHGFCTVLKYLSKP